MWISDIPPEMPLPEARIMCSVEAAERYQVPPDLVFAIALTEGGEPFMVSANTNGTADLGLLQFNTAYLKTLAGQGVSTEAVQSRTCYPFHLAAWRLQQHLQEPGADELTKAACYHSRTPKLNAKYRAKLLVNALKFPFDKALAWHQRFKVRRLRHLMHRSAAFAREEQQLEQLEQDLSRLGDLDYMMTQAQLAVVPAAQH